MKTFPLPTPFIQVNDKTLRLKHGVGNMFYIIPQYCCCELGNDICFLILY